jgi:hypothetical protein
MPTALPANGSSGRRFKSTRHDVHLRARYFGGAPTVTGIAA